MPLLLSLITLLAAPLCAQAEAPSPSRRGNRFPVEVVSVEFGANNIMTAERWTPIRVLVTSGDEAFTGALIIQFLQDPTQSTRIIVPFSTTPGKTTPIDAAAALPRMCDKLTLTITDGRRERKVEYDSSGGSDSQPLPQIGGYASRILIVGESTATQAFPTGVSIADVLVSSAQIQTSSEPLHTSTAISTVTRSQPVPKEQDPWTQINPAPTAPENLPMNWMAYEGFDLVVGRADELAKADPRARAALMTWVQAGGRLLVEIDQAGNTWRQFLGDGPDSNAVDISPQTLLQPGAALGKLLELTPEGADQAPPPAFKGRPITISTAGAANGWRLDWEVIPPTGTIPTGLLATGPVGAGMVTLLGIDPQRMPPTLSVSHTRSLWRSLLMPLLPARVTAALAEKANNYDYYDWGSGGDQDASTAIRTALDRVSSVPPLGQGVFILIAASMLALVLMIGPIDAIVLKRYHLSQRSWLTALTWIAIASAIGYFAPSAMRSGTTYFSRFSSIDTICDAQGNAAQSWQTSVTGIFGGRPTSIELSPDQHGRWWRGVSPLNWYADGSRAFSPLTLPIRADPQDPLLRQAAPEEIALGQWTFRTLLDQAPGRTDPIDQVTAQIEEHDGDWRIVFNNLPKGARVTRVRQKGLGTDLNPQTDERGRWFCLIVRPFTSDAEQPVGPTTPPDPDCLLPLVRDRLAALEARASTPHWALFILEVTGLDSDLELSGEENIEVTRSAVIRLLVPVGATR